MTARPDFIDNRDSNTLAWVLGKHQGHTAARFLVEQIIKTGLEPAKPPLPLPPIAPEDIDLLCWIGIEPGPQ